jgi:hypothetical protein
LLNRSKPVRTSIRFRVGDEPTPAANVRHIDYENKTTPAPVLAPPLEAPGRHAEADWQQRGDSVQRHRVAELPARVAPRVRQAQAAEVDPFDDPFGDRSGNIIQPNAPTAPARIRDEQPYYSHDPRQVAQQEPAADEPPKTDEPSTAPTDVPCKHIYNGVDCCFENGVCIAIHDHLKKRAISTISLDITPRYNPGASIDESQRMAEERLAQLQSRNWTDRGGRSLAVGRFANLHNGRVIIRGDDGLEQRLSFLQLSDEDRCYVTAWWSVPPECTIGLDEEFAARQFMPITMAWKATGACHKPLYFEQVQLERHGHTAGPLLQPLLSGAHFFGSAALLPYNMGIHPMHECQYPLGHYRVGNCAPWLLPAAPISLRGGLMQAGAVVGGVFILP